MTNLPQPEHINLSQPVTYQISVQGIITPKGIANLETFTITTDFEQEITTFSGTVPDQAALFGLLSQLFGLGLPLLAVNRVITPLKRFS